jgi:chitin disaccharide deacetylase
VAAAQIILTADDFGRSAEVNSAILAWAKSGALTQASLMVNEAEAAAGVALGRVVPGLRIGLHLTLCDGKASNGAPLPRSPAWAGLRYAFWPGARAWLRGEIEAQFARFLEFNLPPTYWDGHTHLHLHPVVLPIAMPIARRRGFTATRLVREPGPPALLPWIFRRLSNRVAPRLGAAGISFTDFVFGLRNTGRMEMRDFEQALAATKRGTVEIYFHPGADPRLPEPEAVAELLRAPRLA